VTAPTRLTGLCSLELPRRPQERGRGHVAELVGRATGPAPPGSRLLLAAWGVALSLDLLLADLLRDMLLVRDGVLVEAYALLGHWALLDHDLLLVEGDLVLLLGDLRAVRGIADVGVSDRLTLQAHLFVLHRLMRLLSATLAALGVLLGMESRSAGRTELDWEPVLFVALSDSPLLLQSGGFEGVGTGQEALGPRHLAAPDREDPARRRVEFQPALATPRMNVSEANDAIS
jgi:hypothetical protein